jgi:hypothetical protein
MLIVVGPGLPRTGPCVTLKSVYVVSEKELEEVTPIRTTRKSFLTRLLKNCVFVFIIFLFLIFPYQQTTNHFT